LKKQGLTDSSHAFMALSLEPVFCSIDAYVDQIEQAVQLVTEASELKPILVCHSMGGLAARAWLERQTFDRVQHVVTIGTPHNGTWLARFAQGLSGHQMRQGSDWLRQLDERMPAVNKSTLFTCWYSNCDNVVFPTSTAMLPGADNRFVRGAGHLKLAFLPEVMSKTLAMIYLPTRPNVVET
jgi:triacylglycerol esterase/lipase EstA (alpha/beta hydrolase family)